MGAIAILILGVLVIGGAIRLGIEIISDQTHSQISRVIGAVALPVAFLLALPGIVLISFGLLMGLLSPNFDGSSQVWGARQFFGAGFKLCLMAVLMGSFWGLSEYVEDQLRSAVGRDKRLLHAGMIGMAIFFIACILSVVVGFRPIAGWIFTN